MKQIIERLEVVIELQERLIELSVRRLEAMRPSDATDEQAQP